MVAAAVLVNLAFTGLGAVFDYPEVLKHPPAEASPPSAPSQGVVSAWFLLLALGAALLAPVAIGVGRLSDARAMRFAVPVGVAAAAVQVVGLLRWPLLVPGWAAAERRRRRSPPPTACWATSSARRSATCSPRPGPGWCSSRSAPRSPDACSSCSAAVAAVLILAGVFSPLDLPVVDLANFVGYVLWSVWLLIFAAVLVRRGARRPSRA